MVHLESRASPLCPLEVEGDLVFDIVVVPDSFVAVEDTSFEAAFVVGVAFGFDMAVVAYLVATFVVGEAENHLEGTAGIAAADHTHYSWLL